METVDSPEGAEWMHNVLATFSQVMCFVKALRHAFPNNDNNIVNSNR